MPRGESPPQLGRLSRGYSFEPKRPIAGLFSRHTLLSSSYYRLATVPGTQEIWTGLAQNVDWNASVKVLLTHKLCRR
jgi:hypothetical protein